VLHRNRRLLLWWSQQKKDVNDVNLQFDNGQSGHGPPSCSQDFAIASQNLAFLGPQGPGASKAQPPGGLPGASSATARVAAR